MALIPLNMVISFHRHKKIWSRSMQRLVIRLSVMTLLHPECLGTRLHRSTLVTTHSCKWHGTQCFRKGSLFLVTHPCACYISRPLTQSKHTHFCKSRFLPTLGHETIQPHVHLILKSTLIPPCHLICGPHRVHHSKTMDQPWTGREEAGR